MPIRKTRSKPSSNSSNNGTPFISPTENELHEMISARAYELYLQRATAPGDELTDWLKAEMDVLATANNVLADTPSPPAPRKRAGLHGQASSATRVRSKPDTRKTRVPNTTV